MSTTEILFSSPALHSLKRTQLVQLCKRHNIKANGKNVEIIARLKQHALNLPADAPLDVAVRSENDMSDGGMDVDDEEEDIENCHRAQRPSEMWEVVMEDIPEEGGESQGSLSYLKNVNNSQGNGEFGSLKAASVTSSIKAIATSLGLKRQNSTDPQGNDNDTSSSKASSRKALTDLVSNKLTNKSANTRDRDSFLAHAIPYSSLPPSRPSTLPQTDPFDFGAADISMSSIDRPIPGLFGLEGVGVEASEAPFSTIRLITTPFMSAGPSPPKLRPLETAFDLVPPTPGAQHGEGITRWPMSPGSQENNVYPSLLASSSSLKGSEKDEDDVEMPGGLSPSRGHRNLVALANKGNKDSSENEAAMLSPPRSQPFVFGSPNPRYSTSNKDFTSAASSILAEFNARLGLSGTEAVGMDVFKNKTAGHTDINAPLNGGAFNDVKKLAAQRFEKVHEEEFKKMASIKDHYAARRGGVGQGSAASAGSGPSQSRKRKSTVLSSGIGNGRPSIPANRRRSSTRVISNGTRKRMVPGAFGDEEDEGGDDDEDEEDRQVSKRPRVFDNQDKVSDNSEQRLEPKAEAEAGVGGSTKTSMNNGKQITVTFAAQDKDESEDEDEKKEREAIKRRLEYNKAKRRSSMGRVSVGGGKAPLIANQKHKGASSRFGFLASAKSLVKSVWNRSTGVTTGSSSTIPVPKAPKVTSTSASRSVSNTGSGSRKASGEDKKQAQAKSSSSVSAVTTSTSAKGDGKPKPSIQGLKPPSVKSTSARSASSASTQHLKPTSDSGNVGLDGAPSTRTRSRSRSPLPSAGSTSGSMRSQIPSSFRSKGSSVGASNKAGSGATSNVSSMGTRKSTLSALNGSTVSSIGTRRSVATASSANASASGSTSKATHDTDALPKKRSSSTLLAPTASSLAKMKEAGRSPQAAGSTRGKVSATNSRLAAIHEPGARLSSRQPKAKALERSVSPGTLYLSPKPKGSIFSQPLLLPNGNDEFQDDGLGVKIYLNPITGLPSPAKPKSECVQAEELGESSAGVAQRKGSSLQRKPRISRSRVIAKLDAKRAASTSMSTAAGVAAANRRGRTRSSAGLQATGRTRRSYGATKSSAGGDSAVLLSAKKRVRKSEYARRRSARASSVSNTGKMSSSMDVDEN